MEIKNKSIISPAKIKIIKKPAMRNIESTETPDAEKKQPRARFQFSFAQKSVSAQTISDFFDQLSTLLASGISLLRALEFTRGGIRNAKLNEAIGHLIEKISSGSQLSESLADYPEIFDRVVLGMIKAAEASGRLEQLCAELSKSFAARAEMKNRIIQALSYPFLVASVGVITVCVLLVFVVPKLTTVFDLWETKLPLVTRILLGTASFMSHGGILVPVALGVIGFIVYNMLSHERKKQVMHETVGHMPYINRIIFLTDFVRLTRTWGMLIRSGVPLIEAIQSSKEVLWDPKMRKDLDDVREKTIRGTSLQESVKEVAWFPELAHNFLAVGEETSTLDESFEKIANFYERELDRKVKVMGTYLEPILILSIGLVVGFLVIALLLPIFEMSLVVK